MSCINFRMMKAIIKIFRRETHWRIEEKWGNQFGYNLYGTVNNSSIFTQVPNTNAK